MRAAAPLAIVVVLLAWLPVAAQETGAFDMSTEKPATPGPASPVPVAAPPAVAQPMEAQPVAAPPVAATPDAAPPAASANADIASAAQAAELAILPTEVLRLSGETDFRAWEIDLTRAEAESPATVTVGYKSAVVVAPESSRLRVLINERVVLEGPIAASERFGRLSIRLPVGLLRTGANLIRVEASQRHRTDCSIASTYELWTDIYSSQSSLSFDTPGATQLRRVEDLGAAGLDRRGVAHLRIVAPALGQTALTRSLVRFAQSAALLIDSPSETVSVVEHADAPGGPGVVTAAIGTYGELQPILRSLPGDAATRPIAVFVDDPALGPSTLVVSGPTQEALAQAVDGVARLADDPLAAQRLSIETGRWFAPDAPLAWGAARYKLSGLGMRTQEFSGRRFVTQFLFGLPSDFYAAGYGEATLLLDAAYSGEVLPGSHLDVYVNNEITATTPVATAGGEILRHLPIRLRMSHFKPGPNLVRFEAQLLTAADQVCRGGAGSNMSSRFVVFDSSEFVMPDYARIGRLPDLGALMGSGFPYSYSASPAALVINEADADTVAAAATLLARMAITAGRGIAFDLVAPAAAGDRDAIFVSVAGVVPSEVLAQLGLDQSLRASWKGPPEEPGVGMAGLSMAATSEFPAPEELDTQATFSRWRKALSDGGGWRGNISGLQDWLQRTFQFSSASLRFLPVADVPFAAPKGATVLLAQGGSPGGGGAWTLLTAPNSKLLREGADALAAGKQWGHLAGRIVTYDGRTGAMGIQPITTFAFVVTEPLSLANLRLIAANWLSDNILAYSLLLLITCIVLGLATAYFLSHIGRSNA